MMEISPTIPITLNRKEKFLMASFSFIPLIRLMIQKALSFIQGKILDPHPIARAR